ncbi:probable LRR receptor-like serine threonine-kinase At2g16250 [Olea europaea subsp. europaea]|uniref:Probable LRR receptor-like serine threonine-kinase At2g16250 n=1 Tax=Olea europaea subsp. europaea TaxID=158383 RepID=A0A8S0R7G9_OLEEU|nr:probable LRR receptor-like serine threonine-kinase At2g16250 [Olea europaea subsp. europaea]
MYKPAAYLVDSIFKCGFARLETGKLGISASSDANLDWLQSELLQINVYDKELVINIVDPSLIIDEDLLEEVWAVAIVAKSCLNPNPSRQPVVRYILKALENPLKGDTGVKDWKKCRVPSRKFALLTAKPAASMRKKGRSN